MSSPVIDENSTSSSIYHNLGDYDDNAATEIKSLCMSCHGEGLTRLLFTKIPFFKEIIISSFACEECGYSNREVQSAGCIQEKGLCYTVKVKNKEDLNRQVVKSEYASIAIPEVEFEFPSNKKSEINTVEGFVQIVIDALSLMQSARKVEDPENYEKIEEFIKKLKSLLLLKTSFTLVLDDISGNSFVENPFAPQKDPQCQMSQYKRTLAMDRLLGLEPDEDADCDSKENAGDDCDEQTTLQKAKKESVADPLVRLENLKLQESDLSKQLDLTNEVLVFESNCSSCNAPCNTNMKVVDIPYFKQVVIMANACDHCGLKENEVKSGTGIGEKGKRVTLRLENPIDLNRDLLKSDTCSVSIPELQLELVEGTLGGKFTTVEGLLTDIHNQLSFKNPFYAGDSAQLEDKKKMSLFCEKLLEVIEGKKFGVHIILDDPSGNSYMQNLCAPHVDPQLTVEEYERTEEHNDILGLTGMNTENYMTNFQHKGCE